MESLSQKMDAVLTKLQTGQPAQQQAPPQLPNLPQTQQIGVKPPAPMQSGGVSTQQNQQQPFYCYECGAAGHIARNCRRRNQQYGQSGSAPQHPDRVRIMQSGRTYFSRRSDRRYTQRDKSRQYHSQPNTTATGTLRLGDQLRIRSSREGRSPYESEHDEAQRVYLTLKIAGKSHGTLLDTCEVTVIPARLVKRRAIRHTTRTLIAANGTEVPILGWTTLKAYVGDTEILIHGLVSEHIVDVMLGMDWMQDNDAYWNFVRGEVTIEGTTHKLSAKRTRGTWCRRVIVARDVTVPPSSQLDLPTKTVYRELRTVDGAHQPQNWTTENSEVKKGLLVARTLLPNRAEEVPVRVLNSSRSPIHLCRGTFVSELHPVIPVDAPADQPTPPKKKEMMTDAEVVEDLISRVDSDVTGDIRERLKTILTNYSSVFSKGEYDLGWTDLVTHRIDTGNHRPVRQQLRRYPPAHLEAIDEHLDCMLKQGVIEPAASPWASNVVLAKKADGSLRCCIDFRQVNDHTRKDAYPLSRTAQCLDAMNGSFWYSTFDLRCGFLQVKVDPADADKTAFITRRGMFRFNTMPFG